jgi:hypothetical protein
LIVIFSVTMKFLFFFISFHIAQHYYKCHVSPSIWRVCLEMELDGWPGMVVVVQSVVSRYELSEPTVWNLGTFESSESSQHRSPGNPVPSFSMSYATWLEKWNWAERGIGRWCILYCCKRGWSDLVLHSGKEKKCKRSSRLSVVSTRIWQKAIVGSNCIQRLCSIAEMRINCLDPSSLCS